MEQLQILTESKTFLGSEFLTWLWYQSENMSRKLSFTDGDETYQINFWIDDRLTLLPNTDEGVESTFKGGNPSRSEEARLGLHNGKIVKEMKLGISLNDTHEFHASVKADDLKPRCLTLPASLLSGEEGEEQEQDPFLLINARLHAINLFCQSFDTLFAHFTQERTANNWQSKTLTQIQTWMHKQEKQRTIH